MMKVMQFQVLVEPAEGQGTVTEADFDTVTEADFDYKFGSVVQGIASLVEQHGLKIHDSDFDWGTFNPELHPRLHAPRRVHLGMASNGPFCQTKGKEVKLTMKRSEITCKRCLHYISMMDGDGGSDGEVVG